MQVVTARDDRCRKFVVVYLFIISRERIDIESIRIEKIGELLRTVDIDILRKTKFFADLQEPLDDLDRCKAMIWILECRHTVTKKANQLRLARINLDNA